MKFEPHEYQKRMIQKVIDTPRIGLFLDMGEEARHDQDDL